MIKHLWEVDHPYYCNEGNYFASSIDLPVMKFDSWDAFLATWGDADLDMNLVFRWDWSEDTEDGEGCNFNGDVNYRNGLLLIFVMGQRKGLYQWTTVSVCRADEPAVIAYLQPRWLKLLELWSPLSGAPDEG